MPNLGVERLLDVIIMSVSNYIVNYIERPVIRDAAELILKIVSASVNTPKVKCANGGNFIRGGGE